MSHVVTLSSSAERNGIEIDFRGIVDPDIDPGVPGGRELVALGHTATLAAPDPSSVEALASAIGPVPAISAVEIAGVFTMVNTIMDTTGSHVPSRRLELAQPVLEQIGAMDFPNAALIAVPKRKPGRKLRRIASRLRR